jgi:hypothetical protein
LGHSGSATDPALVGPPQSACTNVLWFDLVELERTNLGSQLPQPPTDDRKSFIPYLAYGLSGMSIEQVIDRVNAYYKAHPDQRNQPVLNAIFQEIVMPRLKEARARSR